LIYKAKRFFYRVAKSITGIHSKFGLRIWLTIISLSFLSHSILINLEKISQQSFYRSSLIFIWFSFLITSLSVFINAFSWKFLVEWLGYRHVNINLVKLFVRTNLFKYTPGGVWHFVERVRVIRNEMSLSHSLLSVFLEPLLMLVAAFLWLPFGSWNISVKLLSIVPLFLFHPRARKLFLNLLEKLIYSKFSKFDSIEIPIQSKNNLEIDKQSLPLKALLTEMLFVLVRFLGFWLCLKAFLIGNSLDFFDWLSAFSLAWVIGLVVPAAPGGTGVFESSILLIVGKLLPDAPLLSALLCYRVVATFSDVIGFVIVKSGELKLISRWKKS